MESQSTIKPISGAERIRNLTDTDEKFKAFDSYPWTKDQTFMFGLKSILGPPPTSTTSSSGPPSPTPSSASTATTSTAPQPVSSPSDMAIRARLFYYSQRIGVHLSYDDYKTWLLRHPDHQPPSILPEEYKKSMPIPSSSPITDGPLPWQSAAPKTPLYVDKSKSSTTTDGKGTSSSTTAEAAAGIEEENAPYPQSFTAIVELIASGKPVPGIREIPNTVIHDPNVTPFGKMARPRKPWEKGGAADPSSRNQGSNKLPQNVDASFPLLSQTGGTLSS